MKILWDIYTDQGGRTINEDSVKAVKQGKSYCFVLADGLGAHDKGEVASEFICEYISSHFKKKIHNTKEGLRSLLVDANNALIDYQEKDDNRSGLRTTVVLLIITQKISIFANIGDSRLYQLQFGSICYQSKDHSVCQKLVDWGELTKDQIRHHEDRNRLTCVMGEHRELSNINLKTFNTTSGAFLLCSDGLWENVSDTEIEEDFKKAKSPGQWINYMSQRAFKSEGDKLDNISAIAVYLNNRRNRNDSM